MNSFMMVAAESIIIGELSEIVRQTAMFLILLGVGIAGFYVRKIDKKVDDNEKNKLDKKDFIAFQEDIKSQFNRLHREMTDEGHGITKLMVQVAVLTERFARLEILIENCTGFSLKSRSKDGRDQD